MARRRKSRLPEASARDEKWAWPTRQCGSVTVVRPPVSIHDVVWVDRLWRDHADKCSVQPPMFIGFSLLAAGGSSDSLFLPSAQQPTKIDELTDVVGVMIRHQKGFAQNRLPVAPWDGSV
jgi:hypothetical protein